MTIATIKGYHEWTESEKDIIRRDYKRTYQSALEISIRLSQSTGEHISRCAVSNQAGRMGLRKYHRPRWTPEEKERLPALITLHHIDKVAKMMKRSKFSIRNYLTRNELSTKIRDGWFTADDACGILGADHKKLQSWIDAGSLFAEKQTDVIPKPGGHIKWHITSEALANFIRSCAYELTGRNVDIFMIVELLKGEV